VAQSFAVSQMPFLRLFELLQPTARDLGIGAAALQLCHQLALSDNLRFTGDDVGVPSAVLQSLPAPNRPLNWATSAPVARIVLMPEQHQPL
jgi:hypothetical protein